MLKDWLIEKLAEEAAVSTEEMSADQPFENMDLDSLSLLNIAFELEAKLNREINPSVFTEFNTVNKFLMWVEGQT